MTYFRERPIAFVSEESDYRTLTDLCKEATNVDNTSAKFIKYKVSVPTAGITIDLGMFSTIVSVIVQNLDTTNYTTFAGTNDSASAAVAQRLAAGEFIKLCDVKVSSDFTLTANTAACECLVIIVGT